MPKIIGLFLSFGLKKLHNSRVFVQSRLLFLKKNLHTWIKIRTFAPGFQKIIIY
jgi:hypothetical protein